MTTNAQTAFLQACFECHNGPQSTYNTVLWQGRRAYSFAALIQPPGILGYRVSPPTRGHVLPRLANHDEQLHARVSDIDVAV